MPDLVALKAATVSYYRMDEASGDLTDLLASADLAAVNSPGSAAGKVGYARSFAAASAQYASSADAQFATGSTQSWFWTGWIYFDAADSILVARDNNTGRVYILDYSTIVGGKLSITAFKSGGGIDSATWATSPSANTWYFVAVGYDASADKLWISVDAGTKVESGTMGGLATAAMADSPLNFARRAYPSAESYYNGRLDDWAYGVDYVPTADDLTLVHNSGAGKDYADWVPPAFNPRRASGIMGCC